MKIDLGTYRWLCPECKRYNESEIGQAFNKKSIVACQCGHCLKIHQLAFIRNGTNYYEWHCDELKAHDYTDEGEIYECEEDDDSAGIFTW